jgi:dTDP-4-dehydrorhamnose reductase
MAFLSQRNISYYCLARKKQPKEQLNYSKIPFSLESPSQLHQEIEFFKPTHSIFAAGFGGIQASKEKEKESFEIDVRSTFEALKILDLYGIQTLFFSTSLIWDRKVTENITMQMPRTVYGYNKYQLEKMIETSNLNLSVLRLGKVIHRDSRIVRKVIQVLQSSEKTIFFNNLYSSPVHISSVIDQVELWIVNSLQNERNLVPHEQLTEIQILNALSKRLSINLSKVEIQNLNIPDDELPLNTECPNEISNIHNAIYGVEAIEIEVTHILKDPFIYCPE